MPASPNKSHFIYLAIIALLGIGWAVQFKHINDLTTKVEMYEKVIANNTISIRQPVTLLETPQPLPSSTPVIPSGATARCGDGSYSFSENRRGTCSRHGGVAQWLR